MPRLIEANECVRHGCVYILLLYTLRVYCTVYMSIRCTPKAGAAAAAAYDCGDGCYDVLMAKHIKFQVGNVSDEVFRRKIISKSDLDGFKWKTELSF